MERWGETKSLNLPVASQTMLSLDSFKNNKKKSVCVLGNLSCIIGNFKIWKMS